MLQLTGKQSVGLSTIAFQHYKHHFDSGIVSVIETCAAAGKQAKLQWLALFIGTDRQVLQLTDKHKWYAAK